MCVGWVRGERAGPRSERAAGGVRSGEGLVSMVYGP